MNRCVAVTRAGNQCRNRTLKMYCGTHINSKNTHIMFKNKKIKKINEKAYNFLNNIPYENLTIEDIQEALQIFNIYKEPTESVEFLNFLMNIHERQRIEKIENEKLEEERLQEEERIRLEKEKEFKEINECKCCFGEYEHNELISCDKANSDNRHLICTDCMKRHIGVCVENSNIELKCIFDNTDNCNGFYNENTFRTILSEDEYKKFIDLYEISEIRQIASIIPNYQICPKCRKYGIQIESNNRLNIICGKCNFEWCNLCQKQSHQKDCFYINISIDHKDIINHIENLLVEIRNKIVMHTCPHCNSRFIKEEGCNLIKCSTCNGHSCYVCGVKIFSVQNSFYHHFKGHALNKTNSNCELWNGKDGSINSNIDSNNRKLLSNYKNILKINSVKLRPVIYKQILKYHYKDNLKNEVKKIGKEFKLESECIIL